jgi:DNA-directed RNA polymerase subunit RPC12/RpoP
MPVCPQCDNRPFSNKEALLQHMKSSSAWHPFCSICDRRFVSQTAYDAVSRHGAQCRNPAKLKPSDHLQHMTAKHPPTYDCIACSKSFHAPFALEDHYRGSQSHPNCVRCGRGFLDDAAREEVGSLIFCPSVLIFKLAHSISESLIPSCPVAHAVA